jgi:hypothetical protein
MFQDHTTPTENYFRLMGLEWRGGGVTPFPGNLAECVRVIINGSNYWIPLIDGSF